MLVTLDVDERSRARLIASLNRIQDSWSKAAQQRGVLRLQTMMAEARYEREQAKQREKAEAALNRQRSVAYVRTQERRRRSEDQEQARADRAADRAKRQQERAHQRNLNAVRSLNAQRSAAYVQSQNLRLRHEAREREQQRRQAERERKQRERETDKRVRAMHERRMRNERLVARERQKNTEAAAALQRQRSRAYIQSQQERHRQEMRNIRTRERAERRIMTRSARHLRLGAVGVGLAAAGGFYAFQNLLNERGREAIQLRGTSDALGIPLDDLQQLIYVARIMGLWFGPAELADAQNKMIEIQRDMRRYDAGELGHGKLRIGARKLIEYGLDPEDATMANMLPIIELMASGWAKGDREVMAALNNMFEEQVGKRVGVISTMMATGEWQNMLAVDLMTAEEIDSISRMYRQMILVIHELEVGMQRFLVGNKDDVNSFIDDLRTMVHASGELLDNIGALGPVIANIVPILVGIGVGMGAVAVKIWGAAWAAAALSAATGQWQNLALFAAVAVGAGVFTRFLIDKILPDADVDPPATKENQLKTISTISDANKKIEGDLDNILCVARNAEKDAEDAKDAAAAEVPDYRFPATKPRRLTPRTGPGPEGVRPINPWLYPEIWSAKKQTMRPDSTITNPAFYPQVWMPDDLRYPEGMDNAIKQLDYTPRTEEPENRPRFMPSQSADSEYDRARVEVLGDMNIYVDSVSDIEETISETEHFMTSNE